MRRHVFLAALLAVFAARAAADDQADFKNNDPPRFAFVSDVNPEKNLLKLIVPTERTVPAIIEVEAIEDGKKVVKRVAGRSSIIERKEETHVLSKMIITTADGKEVPEADLVKVLKGKVVLLARDANSVHDVYRKLLGKDTYVIAVRRIKL
jgi:hypothetical protein